MDKPKLTFQQRKDKAKKLVVLYAKALDAAHKIAAQLETLGFDPQGRQIRNYKGYDDPRGYDPGRYQKPTSGMGGGY